MVPDNNKIFRKLLMLLAIICGTATFVHSQSAGRVRLPDDRHFVFSFGTGYGISNNPCRECEEKKAEGGAVFAFALGYRINNHFRIDFGPSFWIAGNDLFNNSVADSERPNNKRTVITFSATYLFSEKFPLHARLGAGAGVLNYTPERAVVTTDQKSFEKTEIFKGFSVVGGLGYEVELSPKIELLPAVNFWYLKMEKPDFEYASYMDHSKPSLTTEIRLQLNYLF